MVLQIALIRGGLVHLDNDLQKYLPLWELQVRNETLFFAAQMSDPAAFMPFVYTPSPATGLISSHRAGSAIPNWCVRRGHRKGVPVASGWRLPRPTHRQWCQAEPRARSAPMHQGALLEPGIRGTEIGESGARSIAHRNTRKIGGCDDGLQTRLGSMHAREVAFAAPLYLVRVRPDPS